MYTCFKRKKRNLVLRSLSVVIVFVLSFSLIFSPAVSYAQVLIPSTVLNLPVPGTMVPVTAGFSPLIVKGVNVYPNNPLKFDFIIDRGDTNLNDDQFRAESEKLIKYFLASLTVPEEEMWVNLSPYEKDRIIPNSFGKTEMGRDLLAQDYLLKQLSSSLMHPEEKLGKEFWDRVYTKAQEKFGTTEIPMNTFNKIWIVPEEAFVYEHTRGAFVVSSHLKVMLEEDYIALEANQESTIHGLGDVTKDDIEIISGVSSQVVREVLLPEIEREVNEGTTFANLRQIYNSVILASWYKQALKDSLLGQVYVNKQKTAGVEVEDKEINQKIYNQYLEAFKKGVYNFIKEDYDPVADQIIPRKYFSGGALTKGTDALVDGRAGKGNLSSSSQEAAAKLERESWEKQQAIRAAMKEFKKGEIIEVDFAEVSDNSSTSASPIHLTEEQLDFLIKLSYFNVDQAKGLEVDPRSVLESVVGEISRAKGNLFDGDSTYYDQLLNKFMPILDDLIRQSPRVEDSEGIKVAKEIIGNELRDESVRVSQIEKLIDEWKKRKYIELDADVFRLISDRFGNEISKYSFGPVTSPALEKYDHLQDEFTLWYQNGDSSKNQYRFSESKFIFMLSDAAVKDPVAVRLFVHMADEVLPFSSSPIEPDQVGVDSLVKSDEVVLLERLRIKLHRIEKKYRGIRNRVLASKKSFSATKKMPMKEFKKRNKLFSQERKIYGEREYLRQEIKSLEGLISAASPVATSITGKEMLERMKNESFYNLFDASPRGFGLSKMREIVSSERIKWSNNERGSAESKRIQDILTAIDVILVKIFDGPMLNRSDRSVEGFRLRVKIKEAYRKSVREEILSSRFKDWKVMNSLVELVSASPVTSQKKVLDSINRLTGNFGNGSYEDDERRLMQLEWKLLQVDKFLEFDSGDMWGYSFQKWEVIRNQREETNEGSLTRQEYRESLSDIFKELKNLSENLSDHILDVSGEAKILIDDTKTEKIVIQMMTNLILAQETIDFLYAENRKDRDIDREDSRLSSLEESEEMSAVQGRKNPGGIDLNATIINMNIQRDGKGVALPVSQQLIENINVQGFYPVIINITPIVNLPLLIGLADTQEEPDSFGPISLLSPAGQKLRFKLI